LGRWRPWLWQGVWSAWLAGVAGGVCVAGCGWVRLVALAGGVAGGCGCGSGRLCVARILG
jgi:hypothetical protein